MMVRENVRCALVMLLLLGSVACEERLAVRPGLPQEVAPRRVVQATPFPFSYAIDPENCAQDEVVDVDLTLDALCGSGLQVARDHGHVQVGSSLCKLGGRILIVCEGLTTANAGTCSSQTFSESPDGLLAKVSIVQVDAGRIPPPRFSSTGTACGSLLEILSSNLQAIAAHQGREKVPQRVSDAQPKSM